MAKVNITNVVVLDNPSSFFNPFQFELTFECIEELREDLEWKMIYVGSAESESYDQVLDTIYVGPVPEGRHIFVFQADPPDVTRIPEHDAVGVTIILLTCAYRGQEFVRVGYFINNEYLDPELKENPPAKPQFEKLQRNILDTKPRVTRFKINWDDALHNGNNTNNGTSAAAGLDELAGGGGGSGDDEQDGAAAAVACNDWSVLGGSSSATAVADGDEEACMEDDLGDNAADDNVAPHLHRAAVGDGPARNGSGGSSSVVVRLNENSNSLAMEC